MSTDAGRMMLSVGVCLTKQRIPLLCDLPKDVLEEKSDCQGLLDQVQRPCPDERENLSALKEKCGIRQHH